MCAVAELIATSGHEQLARNINTIGHSLTIRQMLHLYASMFDSEPSTMSAQQQYALEVLTALLTWQRESGLTLNELAWIQPTYKYSDFRDIRELHQCTEQDVHQLAVLQADDGSFPMSHDSMRAVTDILQFTRDEL